MRFEIKFTRNADGDLDHYGVYEQKLISDGVERFLEIDANVETRRHKQLRSNPMSPWELRLGKYRVFYEVQAGAVVRVLAVGHKVHNELFIRGGTVKNRMKE